MIPARNIKRVAIKSLMQPGYALRVFNKRLKAFISYKLLTGYSVYPEAITLFLTHRCNLRCKMCGQWGDAGVTKKGGPSQLIEELAIDKYREFINQASSFNPNITLFGGEPLLYKHCMDLIAFIKSKGMHCCMITNGTLLAQFAKEIVEYGLDELNISLDGPEDIHDEIRGIPGMYKRIEEGVAAVNSQKKKINKKRPLINLEFTITKHNYKNMLDMIEAARSFKANSLNFHHLIFINQEMFDSHQEVFYPIFHCSSEDWKGFLIEGVKDIDLDRLNENIAGVLSRKVNFSINVYPNLTRQEVKKYYQNPAYIPEGYSGRCISPWMVAYIFPDGNVRPCLNFDFVPGNIKKEGFKKIWNNDKYIKFRGILKKRGIFPICARCTELYRY